MHIVVASKNPVKRDAILGAFQQHFPGRPHSVETHTVDSGVPDQPRGDAETRLGADNRLERVRHLVPQADLWAGLEGGVCDAEDGRMHAFAWIVMATRDGARGAARTATFPLPPVLAELIRQGRELGEADDLVFSQVNSKQQGGAIGLLTDGLVNRKELYEHAALMAMIPLKQAALFAQPAESERTIDE